MAPEAARGGTVDHRTDVYALGCLFYDMLTGRAPFVGPNASEILQHQIETQPVPPSVVAPGAEITPAAEKLILRALQKDPRKRHQTMDELRLELQGCWGNVVYRRDAKKVGATELAPRAPRLTDELDEWLSIHRDELASLKARVKNVAESGGDVTWESVKKK
jgi:serine/threonine protein kinase